jgi:hypothetical protein
MEKTPENSVIQLEKEARTYAWDHFAYHAQQRQTVFNFYLLLVGPFLANDHSPAGLPATRQIRFCWVTVQQGDEIRVAGAAQQFLKPRAVR